jgi:predicted O-linked N-acetylglucosamine transferase (SPINDLY family)
MGVIACQVARHANGVEFLKAALHVRPDWPEALNNLGNALRELGRFDESLEVFRRGLRLRPDFATAHCNLGVALSDLGRLEEAIASFRSAISLHPEFADAYNNLGNALLALGKSCEAQTAYERACQLNPGFELARKNLEQIATPVDGRGRAPHPALPVSNVARGDAATEQFKLGIQLATSGKPYDAIAAFQRALQYNPNNVQAQYNLATVWLMQGHLEEAAAGFQQVLRMNPAFPAALNNLGTIRLKQRDVEEAAACFQRALAAAPDFPEACNNLGIALTDLRRPAEAVAWIQRAIQLRPRFTEAYSSLGNAHKLLGNVSESISAFCTALNLNPDFFEAHNNLLQALHYREGVTLAELATAHAEFQKRFAARLLPTNLEFANSRDAERRLRIGFASSDLARHPVGYFLVRVLEHLDRDVVETFCYSDRMVEDDLTIRCRNAVAAWQNSGHWNDHELAHRIRSDEIDILFDLAGHTARNRVLTFARKPAPIQITWAGYTGTTGLTSMDYILADRHEIPDGFESYYVERVLRMPDGYVTFDPPGYARAVVTLPARNAGFVTFGCFNNPAKLSGQAIRLWAEILHRVPGARLILKYAGMSESDAVKRISQDFATRGVDPNRVEFQGWSAPADLLAAYGRIDIALDPMPFNGGLTTVEALWMGVPVITLPGETFASRHSLSHLSTVGLADTIAHDESAYVNRAVELASDLPRLAELRAGLRERVAQSPLCDGRLFAQHLQQLLRGVWREWCDNDSRSGPTV